MVDLRTTHRPIICPAKTELQQSVGRNRFCEIGRVARRNKRSDRGRWFNGKILRRVRMPKYQLKLYDSLVWLWRGLDRLLPWHGLSVIAVGRKPEGPTPPPVR